jgi:hypothetical protein
VFGCGFGLLTGPITTFSTGWNVFDTQLKNLAPSDPLIAGDLVIKILQVGMLEAVAM